MNWKKLLSRTIREASGKLPGAGWPDSASRFWQMGLDVRDETVEAGVAELRQILASGTTNGGLIHIALLMHLLRTRLPGVQVSRLWPDVTALLASDSGRPDNGADFFRRLLRIHFPARLAADAHHFRYVRLLLDEAGVGSGRAQIIVEFLTRLTELPIGGSFDDSHLRELVQDEILRDGRDDVEAIGPALFSAGEALLRVRRALLDMADPSDVATWGWSELAEFAHRTAGRQLSFLIPEAERVFSALIPMLGRRMSCVRAFELMNTPGVCIQFPPHWDADSMPKSVEMVPLGILKVIRGTIVREVSTVDEYGFDAEFAMRQPENFWIQKRNRTPVAIRLGSPFEVWRQHQPPSRSRPVYNPKGCCIGYFWSGFSSAGDGVTAVSCPDPHFEIPLSRATSLVPVPEWRWRENGFDLHLSRVAYYDLAERAEIELRADGLVIARRMVDSGNGLIETSQAVVFRRPRLKEGVALSLIAGGRPIASALIRLPRRPLLIDGNRVIRARELAHVSIRQEQNRSLLLVGDESSGEPHCSIGEVANAGFRELAGSELTAFAWTVDTLNGLPAFSWGNFDWPGAERTPVLKTDQPREIDCAGCTLQGSGNVRPVCLDHQTDSGVWVAGAAELSGVDLVTRWGPLVSRRRVGDDARIATSRLVEDLPTTVRNRLSGLVMISVERERVPMFEQLGLYVAPVTMVAHPVRVGSRGRIELLDRAGSSLELSSKREADVDDPELVAELTFPERAGLEPGSGVRFLWFADVYDIRLRASDDLVAPSLTGSSAAALRPSALRNARFELAGDRSRWTFELTSELVSHPMHVAKMTEPGGVLRELTRILTAPDSAHPRKPLAVIARYAGVSTDTWPVEIGPQLGDSRATAEMVGGRLVLQVVFDWTGVPASEISLSVEDQGTMVEGPVSVDIASDSDGITYRATARMDLPSGTFAGMATTLKVAPVIDRIPLKRIAVAVPVEPVTTDNIPAELKRLLADCTAQNVRHACRQAVVLFVRFARERGTVALDADRYAARVDRVFAEVDCAGAASATIRTIGMLLADNVNVPAICPPLSEDFSDFGMTINEVVADVLDREKALGQLIPESLQALRRAADLQRSAATPDNGLNRRLEALVGFCERITRH